MVKVILGLILVAFLLTPAYAQKQKSTDDIIQKMTTDLQLTPEQASAIKPIIEDSMAKSQGLMEQMKKLRQEEEQKMSQILTPEQMIKMQNMRKQHHKEKGMARGEQKENPVPAE